MKLMTPINELMNWGWIQEILVNFFLETEMTGLRSRREGKIVNISLCKGDKVAGDKSVFGEYSDAELVATLKVLALDPCNSKFSRNKIRPLWNQTIRVRKAMALSNNEFPWRKRKLQQFVKERLIALPGSVSGLPSQPNLKKLNKCQVSHASSASCLFNSVESAESFDQKVLLESHSSNSLLTFEDSFLEKQVSSESSFMGDATERSSPCKDMFPLVDSDESINCSNPLSPENPTPQEEPSLNLDETSHSSLVVDNSNEKHLQPPRRSPRLLKCTAEHLQRVVVPVGPCFQADVPEWTGPCNGAENARWLGTPIWPPECRKTKINMKDVGKGRPNSCFCVFPGSPECIRRHILEKRLFLQCDLGPAFLSWKFDEMGEQISKSWTPEQQKKFESLARVKSQSNRKGFLKHASKCFPSKCPNSITNYYFNVYIPRRISMQTRLLLKQVDSDEEEEEEVKDFNYLGFQKNFKGRTSTMRSPSDLKTQYMNRSVK